METLEYTTKLLTHDTDAFGLWRPDGAFRLMQEMAGMHSESYGFPREKLLKLGVVWMLVRVHVLFERYPGYHDDIHAKTWCGNMGKITCPRYVEVTDISGTHLADIATSWVIVDTSSRKIMLPEKAGLFSPSSDIAPRLSEPGKIRQRRVGEKTTITRTTRYSDLDLNGHMNNASYVTWVLDLFDIDWYSRHRIRSIVMSYSAETKPGALIAMTLYRDGLFFEVRGVDEAEGHVVFEAQGEWMEYSEKKRADVL